MPSVNWFFDVLLGGIFNWLAPRTTVGFLVRIAILVAVFLFATEVLPGLT